MLSRIQQELYLAAEHERQQRFRLAWQAYHGQLPKALKVKKNDDGTPGPDDNIRLSFPRLIVDKGASFLFGTDLQFEVDGQGKSETDTWLSECWDANRRMTTLHRLAINGGVTGHAFLKVVDRKPYPRLVVLDPGNVEVRCKPDDHEEISRYTIQWHGVDPDTGRPVAFRQVIEPAPGGWTIRDEESRGDSASWQVKDENLWPYEWAPIFHCQNLPAPNEFWGMSDLEEDVLETVRGINFILSNTARIIRFHAHPKTWGRGFNDNSLKVDVNGVIQLSANGELHNLEMVSDLTSSIEFYKRLKEGLHEITRLPEIATGKVEDVGALSGVALQILYQPLIEKTGTKRLLYGEMLEAVNRALLQMRQRGSRHVVKPQWPAVLPSDPKGEAETGLLHEQLGVSRDTILTGLGFDPKDEAKKKAKERQADAALGQELLKDFDRGGQPEGEDEEKEPAA